MAETIKSRWLLILWVIAFVIIKIPVLHYPFFWDESWSYAPAVKLMYRHGPSLMPNAIDLYYSRGHPMLFYASAAAWMRIFGASFVSQHSFGLFISVLLLITVYETCLRLFNKKVAALGLLLVSGQVIFFVQSTMVLPEVMIAWLALLTLYLYATGRHWQTFIACTALLFTKESGMVLGLVLGVHSVLYFFNKAATLTQKIKNFLPVFCAGLCMAAFYLLQKKLNGWYLFPEHTDLMDWSWAMFSGKMRFCAEIIFQHQLRVWLFAMLIICGIVAALRTGNFRYGLPLVTGILLYIFIGSYCGYITRRLFIPFLFISLLHTFYILNKLDESSTPTRTRFLFLSLFFLGAYLSFSSLNFFSTRYLMCCIVLVMVLAAWCLELLTSQVNKLYIYLMADCIIILFCSFRFNTKVGDTDPGMYAGIEVQQDIITYCETNKLYNKNISAHSALQRIHLKEPMTGFRHTPDSFTNINYLLTPATDYIIKDNIEVDTASLDNIAPEGFQQVYHTAKGEAWGAIYGRK